jgi:hypothetical protein
MARSKKTIEVKVMLRWANDHLSRKDDFADANFKSGICTAIEQVLHRTNNYNGFYFLNSESENKVGTIDYYSRTYTIN